MSHSDSPLSHDDEAGGAGLTDLTGRQIGRYLVGRRLGSGGVATVYQAYDQVQQQTVALKVLLPSADEKSYGRFRREALTAGALRHPHIVRILQVGGAPLGGIAYIAMELIEGQSLADLLVERRRLSPRDCCNLLAPIARALAFAHRAGVIHRDVKPGNILLRLVQPGAQHSVLTDALDHAVIPLLSDFGIARGLDAPELTSAGRTVGTPAYMAPEQCAGRRKIDGRADIYSLGAVLYRCLVGRLPFSGSTTQILHAHVYEPLTLETPLAERLPPSLVEILRRSLAKQPEERFGDADEMASALERTATELLKSASLQDEEEEATATMTQTVVTSPQESERQTNSSVTVIAPPPAWAPTAHTSDSSAPLSPTPQPLKPTRNLPLLAVGASLIVALFVIGLWLGIGVWRGRINQIVATPVAGVVTLPPPTATKTRTPLAKTPTPTLQPRPTLAESPAVIVVTPIVAPPSAPAQATATDVPAATVESNTPTPSEETATGAPTSTSTPTARATPTLEPTATSTPTPELTPTPALDEIVIACNHVTDEVFSEFIAGLPPESRIGFLCPNGPSATAAGRLLPMQNGFMLQLGDRPDVYIYYVAENQWERAASAWRPGDPPLNNEMEPQEAGLYLPPDVFGALWVEPRRQSALGFALAPEATIFDAVEQSFPGGVLIANLNADVIYPFLTVNLRL